MVPDEKIRAAERPIPTRRPEGAARRAEPSAPPARRKSLGEHLAVILGVVTLIAMADVVAGAAIVGESLAWASGLPLPAHLPGVFTALGGFVAVQLVFAVGVWRLWASDADVAARAEAFGRFGWVLVTGVLWTWAFFAARSPWLGLVAALLYAEAVFACVSRFGRVERLAGAAAVPLFLWAAASAAILAEIAFAGGGSTAG